MFCHECLAENRDTATRCKDCGAKLHVVGKSFVEELQEKSLIANRGVYGFVSGAIAAAMYGVFCAALLPNIFAHKIIFLAGMVLVFAFALMCGRMVANAINDTTLR